MCVFVLSSISSDGLNSHTNNNVGHVQVQAGIQVLVCHEDLFCKSRFSNRVVSKVANRISYRTPNRVMRDIIINIGLG